MELVEQEVVASRDPDGVKLREFLELRLNLMDKAIELQAVEYARRLEDLNHAHRQALQVQQTYVTRELFEAFVAEYRKDREELAKRVVVGESWQQQQRAVIENQDKSNNWRLAIVSAALIAIGVFLRFYKP